MRGKARAVLGGVIIVLAAHDCGTPRGPSCDALVEAGRWVEARPWCAAEYAASRDPAIGRRAAWSAFYAGALDDAAAIARELVTGLFAADGDLILGILALRADDPARAREHLLRATERFRASPDRRDHSRAAQQLAGAYFALGELEHSQRAIREAREAAARTTDPRLEVTVELSDAEMHRTLGDRGSARAAVERALARATDPADRALARFRLGTIELDAGEPTARTTFEAFLAEEQRTAAPRVDHLIAAHLNLGYLARAEDRLADAWRHSEDARLLGIDDVTHHLERGLTLAALGRAAEADAELARAEALNPIGEWAWHVPHQIAIVAARAGRRDEAIAADRRAIAQVAALAARAGTFGPAVIANHRQPHLHLIGLLGERAEWGAVLEVVAQLDAQALLDSRAAPTELAPTAPDSISRRTPPRPLADPASVVEAWRGRRLVIIVPGADRIYRLVLDDGALDGRDLGPAAPLDALARALDPGTDSPTAGRALGEALLGGLPARRATDLLVVGPIAGAPLASLRLGDRLAVHELRLARVPGVLPLRAPAAAPTPADADGGRLGTLGSARVVAIGDPRGNLPAAADEVRRVAARLDGEAFLGAAATPAVFAGARGASLLHLAARSGRDLDDIWLELAGDTRATLADIARLAPAPRVVVLASCAASAGPRDGSEGSLAHAFLDAGARHVVATKWTIADADAARVIDAFYDAGGDRDPVGALAAAQLRLAGSVGAQTRVAFEVIAGRPVR